MLVYRLENAEGLGAYNGYRHGHAIECSASASTPHCPSPYNDGIVHFIDDHVCGFESFKKLEDWFPRWRVLLELTDLRVRRFTLDGRHRCCSSRGIKWRSIIKGEKQLMFIRKMAELVEELDPETMQWHEVSMR